VCQHRRLFYRNCSRHDLFGSRTAQLRARRSSYVAQPSAVQLRWTQRCVRGAGASSGCYVTWRGQARAPSPTRISCRRTPRRHTPISTPTGATRPVTRPGSLLGPPSINRWAPADQRTENTASQPPDAPSQDRSGVLHGNCSRHDRFGSRTAQLRARWSSCFAQASAVQLRWTQRCA
jgi:hypothetical protein